MKITHIPEQPMSQRKKNQRETKKYLATKKMKPQHNKTYALDSVNRDFHNNKYLH